VQPADQDAHAGAHDDDAARLAELARDAPTALGLFAEDGALLAQNPAAREAFGGSSLTELFGSAERAADLVTALRRRGHVSGEVEVVTPAGKVWFLLHVRATRDPSTGAPAIALSAEDLTERRTADRAKDEFISIVNHELRTPLTAIRGALGLLAHDVADTEAQRVELFDIAWDNVLRLGRLVDDLLDVQRLRLGAVDLVLATMEIAPLVQETLDLLAPRATDVAVQLRLVDLAPEAMVRADPGRLVQALSNLVTNAIKHSPTLGVIEVEVSSRPPNVRVTVRDEGPGVPGAFLAKLFAPFSQADSTDARSAGGAGLGLYIVRTLIEAHGGTVGYDPSWSEGAAFYFDLPAATMVSPESDMRVRGLRVHEPR
jgi:PAS domain S-box-containing protein